MKQVEDKSDKVHFFENCSKYIPLRHFNQEHGETYAEQCEYFVNNKKSQSKSAQQQFIMKWFKALSVNEKSLALTTIDKELVQLFKAMYKTYMDDGC